MRRSICAITILVLLLGLHFSAFAESKYVSIQEIRATVPERWTGEYTTKKGETVSIDTPIVVPEVDTVPIVRITWSGPIEDLDESLTVYDNNPHFTTIDHDSQAATSEWSQMEDGIVFDNSLPWDDAPSIAMNTLRQYVPLVNDMQLTCYYMGAYGDSEVNGEYWIHFYNTFHGIPFLVGSGFRMSVDGECGPNQEKGVCPVPLNTVMTFFKSADQFRAEICPSKEVGVDVVDVPLLPFDEILNVLEQRVVDGYVYSLNEVRFGYMVFIDPNKKGKEFVLMPIWAAKGRTTGDPNTPFDLKTSDGVKDAAGYTSLSIIVINAQTGEPYNLYNDARPDRRYVPDIINWDEVK